MESFIQTALFEQQLSLLTLLAVFATGLLTSLTPCVYPMLPITVSVVGNQARSRRHATGLALAYVCGLAITYAGLGMLAATSGQLFGAVASHPLTYTTVALFCLAMAAWMLGWLRLPQNLLPALPQSRSATLNVTLAGALSGLGTSPVLGMLLMFVAAQGDVIWGAALMFSFALGMSGLLLLAGSCSGLLQSLPKSGRWLNLSKYLMAGLMFGAAINFLIQALS